MKENKTAEIEKKGIEKDDEPNNQKADEILENTKDKDNYRTNHKQNELNEKNNDDDDNITKNSEFFYIDSVTVSKLADSAKTKRDKIIIITLFETGCTVNELSNIRIRDIDLKKQKISFLASITRNNVAKISSISKELSDDILNYISEKNLVDRKTSYLFETRINKNITTKRIRQIVQILGAKSSIDNLNPQVLRYSHLVHAIINAIPLPAISKQTGIKKSRLVQILTGIDLKAEQKAYERFYSYHRTKDAQD